MHSIVSPYRTALAAALAALGLTAAGSAAAQSSVTLYGIVDQSVRYTTNANPNNDGQFQLTNGAITNSRFGLKGEEDLGGGIKAIFRLESGIDPQNGRLTNAPRQFDRFAYVGLSGGWGSLKLGRQPTEAFNLFGDFDPLTVGNYTDNAWPFFITGGRIDNAVSYDGHWGGLNVGATYGFGQQPGSLSRSSYWGGRVVYAAGPFSVGGTYQQSRDLLNRTQQMWGLAGTYAFSTARLFVGYLGGRDATGNVDAALNDATRTVPAGDPAANPRHDATFYAGATVHATPALAITGAFYYDTMKHVNAQAGDDGDGKRYTAVLLAEYALSRRTQVYGTVDYNKVSGAVYTELPGKSNQTGVAVGVRHIF